MKDNDDSLATSEVKEDNNIEFILGKGNQSAICGGTIPVKIVPSKEIHGRDTNPKKSEE